MHWRLCGGRVDDCERRRQLIITRFWPTLTTLSLLTPAAPAHTAPQKWYRLVGFLLLAGLAGWVASQPSEFEAFVASNKKIIDDMYAGA